MNLKSTIQLDKPSTSQKLQLIEIDRKYWGAAFEHIIGKIFSQIAERAKPMTLSTISKNIGFLLKNVLFANKKAENHFNKAIEVAKEIGAKGLLGQAYLDLGLLHKAKKRPEQAKECISEASNIFKHCGAEIYLKQAKEVLASLK